MVKTTYHIRRWPRMARDPSPSMAVAIVQRQRAGGLGAGWVWEKVGWMVGQWFFGHFCHQSIWKDRTWIAGIIPKCPNVLAGWIGFIYPGELSSQSFYVRAIGECNQQYDILGFVQLIVRQDPMVCPLGENGVQILSFDLLKNYFPDD